MDKDEFDYCVTHLETTGMIKIHEWRKKCRKLKLLTRLSTEKHSEE